MEDLVVQQEVHLLVMWPEAAEGGMIGLLKRWWWNSYWCWPICLSVNLTFEEIAQAWLSLHHLKPINHLSLGHNIEHEVTNTSSGAVLKTDL